MLNKLPVRAAGVSHNPGHPPGLLPGPPLASFLDVCDTRVAGSAVDCRALGTEPPSRFASIQVYACGGLQMTNPAALSLIIYRRLKSV